MSSPHPRAFAALCVVVAAWLPLNPALGGVAVWITTRRALATSADPAFVDNWSGPALAIAAFMAVASAVLGLLLIASVRVKPVSGALTAALAWFTVLFGWFMTRNNPLSVDWGGDPDGYQLVRPFHVGWLEPVLWGHLACLSAAALAVTVLRLHARKPG